MDQNCPVKNGLTVTIDGPIATVTLNRPDVHNAFEENLIAGLTDAFRGLSDEPTVRAILLTGAGPSFSAGADLDWMRRMAGFSRSENIEDARRLHEMLAAIY